VGIVRVFALYTVFSPFVPICHSTFGCGVPDAVHVTFTGSPGLISMRPPLGSIVIIGGVPELVKCVMFSFDKHLSLAFSK
jgi:hypothetical protein